MKEKKIKVELELTPEQYENIKTELDLDQLEELEGKLRIYKTKSCFDRVKVGEHYYYISNGGYVSAYEEDNDSIDDEAYNIANYCTDKDLIQQQAYRENLNRLLWRFSMQNGGDEINWSDSELKYYIYKDYNHNSFETASAQYLKDIGLV